MKCSDCRLWKTDACTTNPDGVDLNYAQNFACFARKDPEAYANADGEKNAIILDRYGKPVPMGWNWGAFLLPWSWCRRHNVPVNKIYGIPLISYEVRGWPYYLGKYGSWLAWENCEWDSAEHFIRTQRKWAKWGFAYLALVVGLILAVVASVLIVYLLYYDY